MEKQLLHFDEGSAIRDISILRNHVIPAIQDKVVPAFEDLEIGAMDKGAFTDLFFSNGEQTEKRFENAIDGQLNGAGIKHKQLQRGLKAESFTLWENLKHETNIVKSAYESYAVLKFIDFKNGKPVLTEAGRNELQEKYKLYISSEEGGKLRELHLAAVKATNEYLAAIQTTTKLRIIAPLTEVFKVNVDGGVSVSPVLTNYDAISKRAEMVV